MEWLLIVVEALLLLLFYPFKITIKAHAVLQTGKVQVDIGAMSLRLIKVRINVLDGLITINGKQRKGHNSKISISLILRYISREKLLKKENLSVVYSVCDAKQKAMIYALASIIPFVSNVYALQNGSNACLDGDVRARVSIVQIAELLCYCTK